MPGCCCGGALTVCGDHGMASTTHVIAMPAALYDAHIHLADPALVRCRNQIGTDYETIGLKQAVVVGTCPEDWPQVLALCTGEPRLIPAIGLHPWKVNGAPADWQEQLLKALDHGAQAIGEIGLDKWVKGHDLERQQDAFRWQMTQARERNLPTSIHCLKAIGPLMETLRSIALPARGIHLHAYNGPAELIPQLVDLGAYFSFNSGQLNPKAKTARDAIRAVPAQRLLIETDAPDMLPPAELIEFELPRDTASRAINHPANLRCGYQAIANICGIPINTLSSQVEKNFNTYFLR
jgi:TatD DNase family protein